MITIESIKVEFCMGDCRHCGDTRRYCIELDAEAGHPELPLGDAIELACHEHVDSEGWIDGLCPQCVIAENLKDNES